MPKEISSLQEVFVEQLKDLYSAERQIARALPKLARAARDPKLKQGFERHLEETREQAQRIEQICEELEERPTGKKCAAAQGLIEEGQEAIEEDATPEVKDVMLIAAARRVEHYEIAAYTTACELAQALGLNSAFRLLSRTLKEETATDEKLAKVLVPAMSRAQEAEQEMEE